MSIGQVNSMYPKLTKGKPNQVFSLNRIKSSKNPIKSN